MLASRSLTWLVALVAARYAVAAGDDTYFEKREPPKCFYTESGRTVIHYTASLHLSFKCTHVCVSTTQW